MTLHINGMNIRMIKHIRNANNSIFTLDNKLASSRWIDAAVGKRYQPDR